MKAMAGVCHVPSGHDAREGGAFAYAPDMAGSTGAQPVTLQQLETDPHAAFARLRGREPVAWIPALNGWLVTAYDLAVQILRDPVTFTVDHPGFTTAQVVGPSMLSLDGPEHRRHRRPFSDGLRDPGMREHLATFVREQAQARVAALRWSGRAELRSELAGPFAVDVVAELLGMMDVDPEELLRLYHDIVGAVTELSAGEPLPESGPAAVGRLRRLIARSAAGQRILAEAAKSLTTDEVASNAAVMLFGGIETSEGMTATALWYMLERPDRARALQLDHTLTMPLIEESLRLEPAASRVDRYATRTVEFGGTEVAQDELVIVSLAAANRDPAVFAHPDRFDLARPELGRHLTFAQGPHACIGQQLARMETAAILEAVLHGLPRIHLDREHARGPQGLVFRKPVSVMAVWSQV